jgi:hypothetical protein
MLKVIKHFSKHCNYHLQGECLLVRHFFGTPNIGQAVDGDWWNQEQAAIQ